MNVAASVATVRVAGNQADGEGNEDNKEAAATAWLEHVRRTVGGLIHGVATDTGAEMAAGRGRRWRGTADGRGTTTRRNTDIEAYLNFS